MSRTEAPLILVFALLVGAWQLGVEWRPLTPEALAAACDCAVARWTGPAERRGYSDADRREGSYSPRRREIGAGLLRALDCDDIQSGLLRQLGLTAIRHNVSAGTAGKELTA